MARFRAAPLVQVIKVAGDSYVVARLYVIAVGAATVTALPDLLAT